VLAGIEDGGDPQQSWTRRPGRSQYPDIFPVWHWTCKIGWSRLILYDYYVFVHLTLLLILE
jgi:hypothetical protein